MARGVRIYSRTGFYHVILRGNAKQILFENNSDYLYFLHSLQKLLKEESAEIIAYCLMDNHIHLLLHIEEGLDHLIKRLAGKYAIYFNTKYDRTGHVFQDRFKSVPVENDRSLLAVSRYIHNNPQEAGFCQRELYQWSSWHEYTQKNTIEESIVSTDLILSLTNGLEGFLKMSAEKDDNEYLDITSAKKLSDEKALEFIKEELHLKTGTAVLMMPRDIRNQYLREMKKHGLSIRQIERLTGVNRGTISRV